MRHSSGCSCLSDANYFVQQRQDTSQVLRGSLLSTSLLAHFGNANGDDARVACRQAAVSCDPVTVPAEMGE